MLPAWAFALVRIAGLLAVAVVLGLLFDSIALWVALVLGGMLAAQYVNLFRLQRWIRHRADEEPPELRGVWGDLVGLISRIHRHKNLHKRRVTQLLREFRRLSAAMPDGVVVLSAAHEIVWFNRMAASLLGLRRKLDVGLPITNLVRQPGFVDYLRRSAAGQGVVVRARGDVFLLLVVIPAGAQYLMLVRDVTREARLEEMRKDFVANASHELRSPLTVIAGYLDQLADDPELGADWREPVADMGRQAARMREIVDDLLELSRLEAAAEEAPFRPVDMAGLLERLVREAAAATDAAPRFVLDLDPALLLQGNESELHSVAWNLVWNAVKYTPASGTITIRWRRGAGGGQLVVQDTGIGIAPEHLPRLTERFYRVDRARTRSKGGSGLGLAIVKHGLQRHGGRLEIASEEGRGSTFTAHFPARRLLARVPAVTRVS
ncbi:MAG TPA: phosphate regulon sensor histidine kinase PhoR [Steroidobacteraceae bacterium]|nr:phosphate regulon sensor histidine kinase PhoR [Steroidobacteraceae bacterium]